MIRKHKFDMIDRTVTIFPEPTLSARFLWASKSSVWYIAVIRGDIEIHNELENYSNVQDNCVLHSSQGFPLELGNYVSVGHSAVLHGCKAEDNCVVGMNAISS